MRLPSPQRAARFAEWVSGADSGWKCMRGLLTFDKQPFNYEKDPQPPRKKKLSCSNLFLGHSLKFNWNWNPEGSIVDVRRSFFLVRGLNHVTTMSKKEKFSRSREVRNVELTQPSAGKFSFHPSLDRRSPLPSRPWWGRGAAGVCPR